MRNFDRDNRGGPRRDFGGGFGGRREMFKAVCSNCGKECEVPFRPTGSKPVFCSDCFEKQGGGFSSDRSRGGQGSQRSRGGFSSDRGPRRPRFEGNRSFENRGPSQPSQPQNKEQFDAMNAKLDKILAMLTPAPVVETKVSEVEAPKKKVAKKK